MSQFRRVDSELFASPQIQVEDLDSALKLGVTMVINNRPEGESADQTPGDAIAAKAGELGLAYRAIPVTHAGFSETQVTAMRDALDASAGPVLAYCRSGTRSTLLWALAEAKAGRNPDDIAACAAEAGYDIAPIRALVDMLAAQA